MKNSAEQGGCYPQRPKAEVDNTLRDLQNSSYIFLFFGHFNFNRKRKQTAVTNITVRFRMVYFLT